MAQGTDKSNIGNEVMSAAIDVGRAIGFVPLDIKFKKLDDRAVIPQYAHDGDVCMDFTSIDVEYSEEMDCYIYHTRISIRVSKALWHVHVSSLFK